MLESFQSKRLVLTLKDFRCNESMLLAFCYLANSVLSFLFNCNALLCTVELVLINHQNVVRQDLNDE
jgi:hypothetical protein